MLTNKRISKKNWIALRKNFEERRKKFLREGLFVREKLPTIRVNFDPIVLCYGAGRDEIFGKFV